METSSKRPEGSDKTNSGRGGASEEGTSGRRAKRVERRRRKEPPNVTGDVPTCMSLRALDFAEARATELCNMVHTLRGKRRGGGRTFQRLPRHMRRRAASYNVKRLPRRMRDAARKEMEKQTALSPAKRKQPSRKQRRKARNLRSEDYNRRQRQHTWLETHIWHAKRMKMVDRFGYRLAEHVNDKGVRAAYLSLLYGCLLSDISYYCCTEVSGKKHDIIASLGALFSSDTGLTVGAKAYASGQREGKAVVYKSGAYPHRAIGPVQFLWRPDPPAIIPSSGDLSESLERPRPLSRLWIFCHPAMSDELLTEVEKAASVYNELHREASGVIVTAESSRNDIPAVQSPLGSELPATEVDQSEVSATSSSPLVSVRSLKNEIVRFRLLGPRSHAVLMNALKPEFGSIPQESVSQSQSTEPIPQATSESTDVNRSDTPDTPQWWHGHSHVETHSKLLAASYGTLKAVASPAQFPTGAVIGITVRDPRLSIPSKKTDMVSAHYPKKKRDMMFELLGSAEKSESSEGSGSEEGSSGGADTDRKPDEDSLSDEEDSAGDWSDLEEEEIQELPAEEEEGPLMAPATAQQQPIMSLPSGMAYSPIWDEDTRKLVSKSKAPDHLLNRERSKQFVKSPKLKPSDKAVAHIPVLLIQQTFQLQLIPNIRTEVSSSGKHRIHSLADDCSVGAGWDLVLPRNWAMPFWVSLSYRGARACGMQELRQCSLETLMPHFPEDYIDTESGRVHSQRSRQLLEEKFRRYPPDKRRNYGKLLIPNPFHVPWEELIETCRESCKLSHFIGESGDESMSLPPPAKRAKIIGEASPNEEIERQVPSPAKQQCQEIQVRDIDRLSKETATQATETLNSGKQHPSSPASFYVLRSRDALAKLIHFLHVLLNQGRQKISPCQLPTEHTASIQQQIKEYGIDECLMKHRSAFIPVRLEILHRGDVNDRAMICIPSAADLKALSGSKSFQPSETVHPKGMTIVDGESIVIGISPLSKKEVKDVRKRRKGRDREKRVKADSDQANCSGSAVSDYNLCPVTPSRVVIGYVTHGGHRLISSKYGGIGYCTVPGLLQAALNCYTAGVPELLALTRGMTVTYRFVRVSVGC